MEWGAWWGTAFAVAILGFILQGASKGATLVAIGLYVFAGILFVCPIIGSSMEKDHEDNMY